MQIIKHFCYNRFSRAQNGCQQWGIYQECFHISVRSIIMFHSSFCRPLLVVPGGVKSSPAPQPACMCATSATRLTFTFLIVNAFLQFEFYTRRQYFKVWQLQLFAVTKCIHLYFREGLKLSNGAWWGLGDLFTLLGMIYDSLVMGEKMTATEGELLCTV